MIEDIKIEITHIPHDLCEKSDPLGRNGYLGFQFTGVDGKEYSVLEGWRHPYFSGGMKDVKEFGELLIRLGETMINNDPDLANKL